jgi:ssDNA-binding Zn-finger/Zn-ribbon topoisomerase 1
MVNAVEVEMKGKGGTTHKAMKGKCPDCGTTMFRIMPKS